jgi:hypothetical protein
MWGYERSPQVRICTSRMHFRRKSCSKSRQRDDPTKRQRNRVLLFDLYSADYCADPAEGPLTLLCKLSLDFTAGIHETVTILNCFMKHQEHIPLFIRTYTD